MSVVYTRAGPGIQGGRGHKKAREQGLPCSIGYFVNPKSIENGIAVLSGLIKTAGSGVGHLLARDVVQELGNTKAGGNFTAVLFSFFQLSPGSSFVSKKDLVRIWTLGTKSKCTQGSCGEGHYGKVIFKFMHGIGGFLTLKKPQTS
jgi:hypothetical protein